MTDQSEAELPEIFSRRDFPGKLPPKTMLVDRTTKWGNPFPIGMDGANRAEVVKRHAEWIVEQSELMAALDELRGWNLMCWCGEADVERGMCHAVTLRRLANP